jgi:hypothetical protein
VIIGATGHQQLPQVGAWEWVRAEIEQILEEVRHPLVGLSSLAVGADQIFAECVVRRGGSLEAIIPFAGYEDRFASGGGGNTYLKLLHQATRTVVLPRVGSDEESYYAAGRFIVDSSEIVIAVWDGRPAKGLGGTGDIARYALKTGKPVYHINPVTRHVRLSVEER